MDSELALQPAVDVVIIDDEESIREGCRQALEGEGYRVIAARDADEGLKVITEARPRVVLLDLRMPGISGIELLERLPGIDPRIIPIIITGYGSIESAVASMRLGAFDFITKPFDMDQLLDVVKRGLTRYETTVETAPVPAHVEELPTPARPRPDPLDLLLVGLDAQSQCYGLGLESGALAHEVRTLEAEAAYHAKVLGQVGDKAHMIAALLKDLRLVDSIIERRDFKKNALIQILLDIQLEKNWLPRHTLLWVSRRLNIPLARIYEVATFYRFLSLQPQGRHIMQVCLGTSCHVRKAPELVAMVSALLGIQPGQTDPEMLFTLKTVHCLGCCALAPVVKVDQEYYGNPSIKRLKEIIKRCSKEAKQEEAQQGEAQQGEAQQKKEDRQWQS